mmetsp:Transcript_9001/g.27063  ORF Transcript_9001/g.27063 Transcript_9001/m.27063 type:complete len:644 (+) Transcript_9001:35-1966(+)
MGGKRKMEEGRGWTMRAVLVLAAALVVGGADGFYLPGIMKAEYKQGDSLEVIANKLTSQRNQVPYDYYTLPVCNAAGTRVKTKKVNLGQLLTGERAKPTDYEIKMNVAEQCKMMCTVELSKSRANVLSKRIRDGYLVRMNVDNMPLVRKGRTKAGNDAHLLGYPVGGTDESGEKYVNNYLKFKILVHRVLSGTEESFLVVGFQVEAYSVDFEMDGDKIKEGSCPIGNPKDKDLKKATIAEGKKITYVYDVDFERSGIEWATRWDPLLKPNPEVREIQWFSIINSLMVGIFLTALVGVILLRTVLKDFLRYNQMDQESVDEDLSGWKLIHTDVFRPPKLTAWLCILVGTGAQVFAMASVTQVFALAGFLSPAMRGSLLTAMLFAWVLASSVAGFMSARLYSSLEGTASRKVVTLGTAFVFPGITFTMFFMLNLILWLVGSQGAAPFGILVVLLLLWFGLAVPLVFLGAYMGYKQKPYEFPVRTNQIPRVVPPSPIPFLPYIYIFVAGIIPFCVVFMELIFILNSIWQDQLYYMFGFLFIVFLLLTVTSAEMSVVFTYLTLSNEDYRWWWQALLTSGSSGLYVFVYSIYYLATQQGFDGISFVSIIIYIVYMSIISGAFALMTGFIGFQASFLFVRMIYGAIRVE